MRLPSFILVLALIVLAFLVGCAPDTRPLPTLASFPTDAPTALPALTPTLSVPTVVHNADWEPVIQTFDGVEMVLVPPGCFRMGLSPAEVEARKAACVQEGVECRSVDMNALTLSHQRGDVCIEEPFWIDRREMTRGLAEQFLGQEPRVSDQEAGHSLVASWAEASTVCARRYAQLPSSEQWEYVARGPDSLVYPWGDEFAPENVTYKGNADESSANIERPSGASWVGALDMVGRLWEWTADSFVPENEEEARFLFPRGYEPHSPTFIARGGSWRSAQYVISGTVQYQWEGQGFWDVGFRCIRTLDAPTSIPPLPTPLPAATPMGAPLRNADWTPTIEKFDGQEMVFVPAGCFMMGTDEKNLTSDPRHEVCITKPFWIGRYEVTQGEFRAFIEAGGYTRQEFWSQRGWRWLQGVVPGRQAPNADNTTIVGDQYPVVGITWFEAEAYARWRGMRLPTEAEWEYAARGPDALTYTWGNSLITGTTLSAEDFFLSPVGSTPEDVSWVGALDMASNIQEFVWDFHDPDYYAESRRDDPRGPAYAFYHVIRSGYTGISADWLPTYRRSVHNSQTSETYYLGFRVARDAPERAVQAPTPTLEPLPFASVPTVTENSQWTPIIRTFDGIEMVLVPPGCFMMGRPGGPEAAPHRECIEKPYWISRFEITREQYLFFVEAGGYDDPAIWPTEFDYEWFRQDWRPPAHVETSFAGGPASAQGIQYRLEAEAFARWRGMRLPTGVEWEYAARGPDSLIYPWGNEFIPYYVSFMGSTADMMTMGMPVGAYPAGASWVGAQDMSGGLLEYVSDSDGLRGGYRRTLSPEDLRADYALPESELQEGAAVVCGFRLVRNF